MTPWSPKILWDDILDTCDPKKLRCDDPKRICLTLVYQEYDPYDPTKLRCDDPKGVCLSLAYPNFKCNMKSLFIIYNTN